MTLVLWYGPFKGPEESYDIGFILRSDPQFNYEPIYLAKYVEPTSEAPAPPSLNLYLPPSPPRTCCVVVDPHEPEPTPVPEPGTFAMHLAFAYLVVLWVAIRLWRSA